MCADTGRQLDSEEAKAALSVIDDNGNELLGRGVFGEVLVKVEEKLGTSGSDADSAKTPELAGTKGA